MLGEGAEGDDFYVDIQFEFRKRTDITVIITVKSDFLMSGTSKRSQIDKIEVIKMKIVGLVNLSLVVEPGL